MGLDMYLYQAEKISEKELIDLNGKSSEAIYDIIGSALLVSEREYEENLSMFEQIRPYMSPIMVRYSYVMIDKIKETYNIAADAIVVGQFISSDTFGYTFMTKENEASTKIEISLSEMQEKFICEEEEKAFVVSLKEVFYWRKAYDVQDVFHNYFERVENCGYYKVTKDLLKSLEGMEDCDNIECVDFIDTDTAAIFYHEWY